MSQLHDVVTLTIEMGSMNAVFDGIQTHADTEHATLLGCWYSDIGALNKVMVLRRYDSEAALITERQQLLLGGNPFGCGKHVTDIQIDTYALFPFLPAIAPGKRGNIYEMRVYGIKQGCLQKVIDAWQQALPEREARSPLLGAMYALDGQVSRFLNIWPYESLNERSRLRALAVSDGVWPPKGGPALLTTLESSIYLPAPFSPLC